MRTFNSYCGGLLNPGGPVVKNPPCKEEDMGLIPGQETKISHAGEQLSPHAPELVSCNYQSQHATTRKFMYCSERSHMLQLRHKKMSLNNSLEVLLTGFGIWR